MDVHGLDVVYFVKDGIRNGELRYSLRSVCKNLIGFNRVWIFGGCPYGITPDIHVRAEQNGHSKWENVHEMYRLACVNKELTDNFIMFNDDFFIMKPMDKVEPLYRCSLEEHIKILEAKFKKPNNYTKLLRNCQEELSKTKKNPLSYELHTPFIFNKKKLLTLLNKYPGQHCTRTLYGNLYNIGGEQVPDIKVFSSKPDFDYKNSSLLSTEDGVDNINNDVWRHIKLSFKDKSKYES